MEYCQFDRLVRCMTFVIYNNEPSSLFYHSFLVDLIVFYDNKLKELRWPKCEPNVSCTGGYIWYGHSG